MAALLLSLLCALSPPPLATTGSGAPLLDGLAWGTRSLDELIAPSNTPVSRGQEFLPRLSNTITRERPSS